MNPMIIGSIFEIGKSLIQRLIPDPEQRAKAELDLLRLQQEGQLRDIEVRMSAIVMEAQSSDPWTSRARPSFMYVFYFLLICLVVIAPFIGIFFPAQMDQFYSNASKGFNSIPRELWGTFIAGFLGYAGFRTIEKVRKVAK